MTNNGTRSGQSAKSNDGNDLDEGKQKDFVSESGYWGYGKSPSNHRGADVEEFMISGIFTGDARHAIAPNSDGTLMEGEKEKIRKSRFFEWLDLMKVLGINTQGEVEIITKPQKRD